MYILAFGMWQGRQFRPYLKGSVIEFITIDDCYDVLLKAYLEAVKKPDFVETVRKVMTVERLIALRKEQTEHLNKLKIALVVHHFREKPQQAKK